MLLDGKRGIGTRELTCRLRTRPRPASRPTRRRHPMTASEWPRVAGPGEVRDSMSGAAHGCLQGCSCRNATLSECIQTVFVGRGSLDLGDDSVDHPVDDLVFRRDVAVDRHRFRAHGRCELTDGQGVGADRVGERHCAFQHSVSAERRMYLLRFRICTGSSADATAGVSVSTMGVGHVWSTRPVS